MARFDLNAQVKSVPSVSEQGFVQATGTRGGALFTAELISQLAMAGRVVVASDADENDRVTGQTSFAATTPTFLLRVPSGSAALPLALHLAQDGSVAGDFITVALSFDRADRYSSGGTAESLGYLVNGRDFTTSCALYSGATAAAATAARTLGVYKLGEDVDPASADAVTRELHINFLRDYPGLILQGPAALLVFTYAGTTGPTWEWSFSFADIPINWLN